MVINETKISDTQGGFLGVLDNDDRFGGAVSFLADSSDTYVIEALNSGVYLDINVMNTATGCSINFETITLECVEVDASKCFDTKMFFTPNGDGTNDYWSLESVSQECEYKIYIYDRFGKLLVVLKDKDKKWDGTYNGFNMPIYDYWYIVEYKRNNTKTIYKSHFTLKR